MLKIAPEPENKYDKFALQVLTDSDVKIGYVPAFYSKLICHYIAKGCRCELKAISYDPLQESPSVLKVKLICDMNCKDT